MPRLHHVNIIVSPGGADEAARFYEGLLGLRRIPKDAAAGRPSGAWLEVGDGTQLHISERDGSGHPDSHFAMVVDNLEDVLARLAAAGAHWTEQSVVGGSRRGFTRDPAGNRVELIAAREM